MKKFIQGMYQKKNFGVRLTAVILSVIVMGFALSLLVLVDLGTDPCTSMNLAISEKIGMGIGNWQALLNTIIFVFVILLGREHKNNTYAEIGWRYPVYDGKSSE